MRNRRSVLKSIGAIGTVGFLAGCSQGGDGGATTTPTATPTDSGDGGMDTTETETPEPQLSFGGDGELNFNLSPSVPQENLYNQYSPLRAYLTKYLGNNYNVPEGLATRMNVGSNYSAVIQALGRGTADLAETGPFAAAVGYTTDNLEVIIQRYGYGSWTYKSIIATRNDSDISSLTDLEGERVAFSDPLSTSGFLYPAAAMAEAGVDIGNLPEGNGSQAAFTPVFAGGHVQSYTLLEKERVAAAAMGGFVRDTKTGPSPDGWQNVATTLHEDSGLPRAPIVVSSQLSDRAKAALQQAFLDAPKKMYYGVDGEDGTDDDLWFSDVREATIDQYQDVIDKAETLGVGPEFFE